MQNYSISELARIFKITKYTIRHYVDEGLLSPEKNSVSGYYTFSEKRVIRHTVNSLKTKSVLNNFDLIHSS
jgi:DNA-binding transcriptional MerR regulator